MDAFFQIMEMDGEIHMTIRGSVLTISAALHNATDVKHFKQSLLIAAAATLKDMGDEDMHIQIMDKVTQEAKEAED